MSTMKPIFALVGGLAHHGPSARMRILRHAISTLTPGELERIASELEAYERAEAADLAKKISHHLRHTPPSENVSIDAPPTTEGDGDPDDPLALLRAAAFSARSAKL